MKEKTRDLTPPYARFLSPLVRPFPDFDFSFIKPVRKKAVELLKLKPGDRVIDAGCGSGGSFPYLIDAVGPSGHVVGVEISPETCVNTRRRMTRNKWENVELIKAPAQDAGLTGSFHALLMFAAPDVYDSKAALENILPYLKENARIVLFGAKLSRNRLGMILNPVLRMMMKLSHSSTPKPDYEPCPVLAKYVEKLDVKEYFFGLMFLASGTLRPVVRGINVAPPSRRLS